MILIIYMWQKFVMVVSFFKNSQNLIIPKVSEKLSAIKSPDGNRQGTKNNVQALIYYKVIGTPL